MPTRGAGGYAWRGFRSALRAGIPWLLAALLIWNVRPHGDPAAAGTCRTDAFEPELAESVKADLAPEAVADARTALQAMRSVGGKSLDRYVVALALGGGNPDRYDGDPLMMEADEAALAAVLEHSGTFRQLLSHRRRVASAPPSRPQYLSPDVAPETTNDLLEALRDAPKPAPPAVPKPPPGSDVLSRAARFAVVLSASSVKSAAFLSVYEHDPAAFRRIVAVRRDDPGFPREFLEVVRRNLLIDLEAHVRTLFIALAEDLSTRGYPPRKLAEMAVRERQALINLARARLEPILGTRASGGWTFAGTGGTLDARRTVANVSFEVRLPLVGLLLDMEKVPDDLDTAQPAHWVFHRNADQFRDHAIRITEHCHGPVCLAH
ncbi:MAG: hypothetical protein GC151_05890 [Betaproteobacteria bacterium]|nr:hypothetical protein [Betaproteobacteria bacterium]